MGGNILSVKGEAGVLSRMGVFITNLMAGPFTLLGEVSKELIKLTEDEEACESYELILEVNCELTGTEGARSWAGESDPHEEVEEIESIDSRPVLFSRYRIGRLGRATWIGSAVGFMRDKP